MVITGVTHTAVEAGAGGGMMPKIQKPILNLRRNRPKKFDAIFVMRDA
jgi:hypothetical protein